jgi:hypothetical protein
MLGTARQTSQDQQRRVREASEVKFLGVHGTYSPLLCSFTLHSIIYYVKHNTYGGGRMSSTHFRLVRRGLNSIFSKKAWKELVSG